jgi:hypothetical protein
MPTGDRTFAARLRETVESNRVAVEELRGGGPLGDVHAEDADTFRDYFTQPGYVSSLIPRGERPKVSAPPRRPGGRPRPQGKMWLEAVSPTAALVTNVFFQEDAAPPQTSSSSRGAVDLALALTTMGRTEAGLLPQPAEPSSRAALVQVYVRAAPFGGHDKSATGHRYDSVPFANGMIGAGVSCQLVHYVHEEHDTFFETMRNFDAVILRCDLGQIEDDGGSQGRFDEGMRNLQQLGVHVWPSPDVVQGMGAKDSLTKIANLTIGLEDNLAYYTEAAFIDGFKRTMAFQPRVIKQNRGSSGEGIWIVKLKSANYCSSFGERVCADSEALLLLEANDHHVEEHTVAEFIEWCINGRTVQAGTWASAGSGKYLEGGQLVDQRFCSRIMEGELRYNLVGKKLVSIVEKKTVRFGAEPVHTFYGPEEPRFASLTTNFLTQDIDMVMPALGLPHEPLPLWWTVDFILASPVGTPVEQERWTVGEFNCSCVGLSKCLAAQCTEDTPDAGWDDIHPEHKTEVMEYGNQMGSLAVDILSSNVR